METLDELKQLDDFLRAAENREKLANHLPKFTTTELGQRVSLIMGEIFTFSLGSQLNWKGSGKENEQGGKKTGLRSFPFVTSFLMAYIGDSGEKAAGRTKKWLANAPARAKAQTSSTRERLDASSDQI